VIRGHLRRRGLLGLGLLGDLPRELLVELEALLEHRILLELLLDRGEEFETRELQQLDGLLQLRRHHQLLGQPELLSECDRHFRRIRIL
jgi:hypothetical protein